LKKVSGVKLNYEIGPRRAGDVIAIYANNDLATTQLGWQIKYGLKEMMQTAWAWERKIKEAEEKVQSN
jgi:UDP-glucose 4-epimerase